MESYCNGKLCPPITVGDPAPSHARGRSQRGPRAADQRLARHTVLKPATGRRPRKGLYSLGTTWRLAVTAALRPVPNANAAAGALLIGRCHVWIAHGNQFQNIRDCICSFRPKLIAKNMCCNSIIIKRSKQLSGSAQTHWRISRPAVSRHHVNGAAVIRFPGRHFPGFPQVCALSVCTCATAISYILRRV